MAEPISETKTGVPTRCISSFFTATSSQYGENFRGNVAIFFFLFSFLFLMLPLWLKNDQVDYNVGATWQQELRIYKVKKKKKKKNLPDGVWSQILMRPNNESSRMIVNLFIKQLIH